MKNLFIASILLLAACSKGGDPEYVFHKDNLAEFNAMCREIGWLEEFRSDADLCAQRQAGSEGGVTFTGSSTITLWTALTDDFPDYPVRNMGIGGSRLEHIMVFSEALIFQNAPDITVLYIGDNDPYAYDFERFKQMMDVFVANYFHRLPESKLVLLSLKPSPARANYRPFYLAVNELYHEYSLSHKQVVYVDIWTGIDQGDTAGYFLPDALHLNPKGYQYVIGLLTPVLDALAG